MHLGKTLHTANVVDIEDVNVAVDEDTVTAEATAVAADTNQPVLVADMRQPVNA